MPHKKYIDHLLADLDADLTMAGEREISTIFIGGGTPSLLSVEAIQVLLTSVQSRNCIADNAEINIEANPSDAAIDRFSGYKDAGINRISIGIQSFNSKLLTHIGCLHNMEDAKSAAHLASILNLRSFNLDLMHGLPEQTLEQALADLHQAIIFNPPHLSWYQLTIEPNTLFGSRPPCLPDEDTLWRIFEQGNKLLNIYGYQQYEISGYSKSGYQCQHNLNYWRFGDYLGIGSGAHSKLTFRDGRILRMVKTKHPRGFMQGKYKYKQHTVMMADRPFEFFMNRFRLLEPVPRADFTNYTGVEDSAIRLSLDEALLKGYLTETPEFWQITEQGKLFFNELLELFLPEDKSIHYNSKMT